MKFHNWKCLACISTISLSYYSLQYASKCEVDNNECVRVSMELYAQCPSSYTIRWPRTFQLDCLIWFIYLITKFVQKSPSCHWFCYRRSSYSLCKKSLGPRTTCFSLCTHLECYTTNFELPTWMGKCMCYVSFAICVTSFNWIDFLHKVSTTLGSVCMQCMFPMFYSIIHLFAICLLQINLNFIWQLFNCRPATFQEFYICFSYFRNVFRYGGWTLDALFEHFEHFGYRSMV